jgi:hypothetical protein
MITYRATRTGGVGAVLVAIGLIALGTYYLLKNTFGVDLPELEAETVLPIIAIGLGIVILVNAWERRLAARK